MTDNARDDSIRRLRAALVLAAVATVSGAVVAQSAALDRRLDEIAEAHVQQPREVSVRMIEALRARDDLMESASLEQLSRLDIMEARNLILAGRYESGLELLDRVLRRPVDPNLRARALELAANAEGVRENYEQAFQHLSAAMEILPQVTSPSHKAGIYALAARWHTQMGEEMLALENAAIALDVGQKSNDLRSICDAWHSLLAAQVNAGLTDLALQNVESLLRGCSQSGDPVLIASSLANASWVHARAGQYETAVGWAERAVTENRRAGYRNGMNLAMVTLGVSLIETGQVERGRSVLLELEPEFRRPQPWSADLRVELALARSWAQQGRFGRALEYLRDLGQHVAEFNETRRVQQQAYLQVEFEKRRRERDIELLREENRVLQARREAAEARRRAHLLGGAMAGLIVFLLLVLLVRFQVDRKRFRRLSRIDGLTGVFNHRQFHQTVQQALAESRGTRRPSVLVAADVDLFKQVNDRYGHQAGDAVLKYLGRKLREHFAPPCIVGRVGGEEFAIFLPDHNRLQARQRIQLFRLTLEPVRFGDFEIEVTMSFGLSEARTESRLERLRGRADEALYRAKRFGRNVVVDAAGANTP